ncbi:hypothetical protein ACMZZG_24400 [Pseudocitrobacter faecalis]
MAVQLRRLWPENRKTLRYPGGVETKPARHQRSTLPVAGHGAFRQ